MKKTNSTRILDLRKFPKSVREVIKSKKEEINNLLIKDLKTLFSKDSIKRDDFINLFKKHFSSVIVSGELNIDKIKFKGDGTPDLRTLPKSVRGVFKSYSKDAERMNGERVTKILNVFETISEKDLLSIQELSKTNPFIDKWELKQPVSELKDVVLVDDDNDDFFKDF